MVQIVEQGPSDISRFLERASPGLDAALQGLSQRKENQALSKLLGIDVAGIKDPALRKQLLVGEQNRKEQDITSQKSIQQNETLTKYLGKKFADLHSVLNTGEQTKFFEEALTSQSRGIDPNKLLSKWEEKAKGPLKARPKEIVDEQIDETETISPEGITETIEEEIGRTPKEEIAHKEKLQERAYQRNKPYLERLSSMAQDLPKEKLSLQQMKGALDDKDLGSLRNVIAEITGAEWLKSASAQVLNSASKQFLLSSLSGLTGRPNQFLEQQITKALVSPLYRKEANQLIYEGLEGLHDLKVREIEIAEELEQEYIAQGKEPPLNFQKLVRDKLKEEAQAFEKNYEARVKELLSSKDDHVIMISPEGKKGSVPKDQVPDALKRKYTRVD